MASISIVLPQNSCLASLLFYCLQPQDKMSGTCIQVSPGTIKYGSMGAVVCLFTVVDLMSQHIGSIRNKSKVRAIVFVISRIFSRYLNKGGK